MSEQTVDDIGRWSSATGNHNRMWTTVFTPDESTISRQNVEDDFDGQRPLHAENSRFDDGAAEDVDKEMELINADTVRGCWEDGSNAPLSFVNDKYGIARPVIGTVVFNEIM